MATNGLNAAVDGACGEGDGEEVRSKGRVGKRQEMLEKVRESERAKIREEARAKFRQEQKLLRLEEEELAHRERKRVREEEEDNIMEEELQKLRDGGGSQKRRCKKCSYYYCNSL